MHRADEMHPLRGVELARDVDAAEPVVEHVPFVRVAQAQRVGREERGRRDDALRVDGERVHRVEHAVLDRVVKLEVAHDVVRAERLEGQLAAGLLGDGGAPVLEDLQAGAAGPGALDLPGRAVGGGGRDMRRGQRRGTGRGQRSERAAACRQVRSHWSPPMLRCPARESARGWHNGIVINPLTPIGKIFFPIRPGSRGARRRERPPPARQALR